MKSPEDNKKITNITTHRGETAVAFMDMKGSTSNFIRGMAMAWGVSEAQIVDELVDDKLGRDG